MSREPHPSRFVKRVAAAVLVTCVLYAGWSVFIRSTFAMIILPRNTVLLSSERLNDNLASRDGDLVLNSLSVLTLRRDPIAQEKALTLLQHDDPYVWLNAAMYLGSLKRPEAVPYLIKGLRHPAYRSYGESAGYLTAITGQNFGTNFEKWRNWWNTNNPSSKFDFDNGLGRDPSGPEPGRDSIKRARITGPGSNEPKSR